MDKLTFDLKNLVVRNRDGSHGTQAERAKQLRLVAGHLKDLGYKNMGAQSLKTKHVQALVKHWSTERSPQTGELVTPGTIKNRMASVRWWASKVNKQNVVPRTNKELGISNRVRLPTQNKAFSLTTQQTEGLPPYLRNSLLLQEHFGLRREEAAKIVVTQADRGDKLLLASSWTKGGLARAIPIRTAEQRAVIDAIKSENPSGSLIPAEISYKEYLSHRDYILRSNDITSTHGLRHYYAQTRYSELSGGLVPPRLGGPKFSKLSGEEQARDLFARGIVSKELGHSRIDITRVYLG